MTRAKELRELGNTTHLHVDDNGNLGLGATDLSYRLHLTKEDAIGPSIQFQQASNERTWVNLAGSTGHGTGRADRFEINATETGKVWVGSSQVILGHSVGDGSEVLETNSTGARLHKPTQMWTDSGTKYYTNLCTLSAYSTTGAIEVATNIAGHDQPGNANMFSFRIIGYWYSNSAGGVIDMTVGCYCGENNYYNTSVTGTYPNAWKGKIWFGTNTNGKVSLILGDTTTIQACEIAVTDFVQGFYGVNTSYSNGWTASVVSSYSLTNQSTVWARNPGGIQIIPGINRNKLYRSGTGTFTVSNTSVFTTIGPNSQFKLDIHVNVGVSDDEASGNINPYAYGVIERSINGGAWTTADNTGISDQGGTSSHVEMSPPRVGTASNGDSYMWQQDRYRTKNHSSTFIDYPSLNMGDTLQYRLRCTLTNGNHIQFGEPVGYGSDDNYMAQPYGFIVQEYTPWS